MLRIVLGLKDVDLGDASLLPSGRTAGEVPQPRAEIGDLVFDVQDRHRQSVAYVNDRAGLPCPRYSDAAG